MRFMTTTIQIDEETEKKLFQIKLKLEKERGSAVTYNDLINFLLKNSSISASKKKGLKEFRELKGILPNSSLKELLKERERDRIREEKRDPLQ